MIMGVSIIVPIYNAQKYLRKCLNSILNQSYPHFELILVDDGSEDLSGKICDEFVQMDNRIKVIHKKNEGLICARITGIHAASYEWIAFVDADDWVETTFLTCLAGLMDKEEADFVAMGCIAETTYGMNYISNKIKTGIYEGENIKNEFIPKMFYYAGIFQFGLLPYMWNKLFRKKLLESCYTAIDTKIYDGEDVAVVYPYLLRVNKIVVTNDYLYHYRIHNASMTYKKGEGFYENISRLYLYLNPIFRNSDYRECLCPQLNQYMRMMVLAGTPDELKKRGQFCFPFHKVPMGSSIILYGAGQVGIVYYQQLEKTKYCTLVSWVDKNYLDLIKQGLPVETPDGIIQKDYDYIVIANAELRIEEEIRKFLLCLGVETEKIVFGE